MLRMVSRIQILFGIVHCEHIVFIYQSTNYLLIFLLPIVANIAAQRAKFVVRHVGIYMIVVNVFQVGIILFEQDLKVRILDVQVSSRMSNRDRSSRRLRGDPSKNIFSPHPVCYMPRHQR